MLTNLPPSPPGCGVNSVKFNAVRIFFKTNNIQVRVELAASDRKECISDKSNLEATYFHPTEWSSQSNSPTPSRRHIFGPRPTGWSPPKAQWRREEAMSSEWKLLSAQVAASFQRAKIGKSIRRRRVAGDDGGGYRKDGRTCFTTGE